MIKIKPSYILFYKNDKVLQDVLDKFPFNTEPRIEHIHRTGLVPMDGVFEFEHFDLRFFKINSISPMFRGYKAWGILIEKCLYDDCLKGDKERLWILEGICGLFEKVGRIYVIE